MSCGFAIQINRLGWNIFYDSNSMLVVSSNLPQMLNEKRDKHYDHSGANDHMIRGYGSYFSRDLIRKWRCKRKSSLMKEQQKVVPIRSSPLINFSILRLKWQKTSVVFDSAAQKHETGPGLTPLYLMREKICLLKTYSCLPCISMVCLVYQSHYLGEKYRNEPDPNVTPLVN